MFATFSGYLANVYQHLTDMLLFYGAWLVGYMHDTYPYCLLTFN